MTAPRMRFDMKRACDNCPFRKDVPLDGSPDWALDILQGFRSGRLSHSCHKSDPSADGFKGQKHKQHCIGILGLMKNIGDCISADAVLAMVSGVLDWGKVPTENCWGSAEEMMMAYLKKYQEEGLLPEEWKGKFK